MANINLSVRWQNSEAIGKSIRYARVDNTNTPVYSAPLTFVASPASVATNVPNGQYIIEQTSLYNDGRTCAPSYTYTQGCAGLLSISAYLSGNNLIVQYLAPYNVAKVKINVYYPNGGSSTALYVNNGNDIAIPLPSGVDGDFGVTGQSVCDETSQFYSAESNQVVVTRSQTNMSLTNNINNISLTNVAGGGGFVLGQVVTTGNTYSGTHNAFYGPIAIDYTGDPGPGTSATLSVNGSVIQCNSVPDADGGGIIFTAASFSDTDVITITFNPTACPS